MVAPSRDLKDLQLHGTHFPQGGWDLVKSFLLNCFTLFPSLYLLGISHGFPIQDVTRKVSHLAAFQSVSEHFQSAQHDPTGEETQETQKW